MELAIQAQALTKRYPSQKGDHPAVGDLDLAVVPGQLYGLVGPDGAGKTSTIRMLSTVMTPTAGMARVAGFDVTDEAERARPHVGYMPQAFSLYPDLSVIENLRFFADIHGVPAGRRKQRIAELLEFARLTQFQRRRSQHLSGGMRKKLALACALVHDPQVLLLDEPTTGVDPVSRRELWRILTGVIQRGVTVLVSTPYMDEAERCHQVGIMYGGRLLTSGEPAALMAELPFEMLEVKARPRRVMRQVVEGTAGILHWRPVGDRLRLSVQNPDGVQSTLAVSLPAAGAQVSILRRVKATMEDVFMHLVETRRARWAEA